MREDQAGFLYPQIEYEKCLECGVCVRTCPVMNSSIEQSHLSAPSVYAAQIADCKHLSQSSSGGVFVALAKNVIENGGVVYGAAFDADLDVKHMRAEIMSEVAAMQGSKYVQSNIGSIFISVKQDLLDSRVVLFSGTPCEVAGLNAYLEKPYPNLITVDILCHGVPSHKLWHAYLEYLEFLRKSKITDYRFRDKSKWGWGNWGSYTYEKNARMHKHYFTVAADYFYSLYFKENCFRESCYLCKFASLPRQGDITLGDYWGIANAHPEFNAENGASVVFINTEIGQKYFELIRPQLYAINSLAEHAISNNKTLVMPTQRPASRNGFYERFNYDDFEASAKRYCRLKPIRSTLVRYIPSSIKKRIKMLLGSERSEFLNGKDE